MQMHAREIMIVSLILNALVFIVLASGISPLSEYTQRFAAGFFLMTFVLAHGWSAYGFNRIAQFFFITFILTWGLETLSISTGFPFGRFEYADTLGIKIGDVPLMIIPAYFFNGYLAWTMALLFVRNPSGRLRGNQIVLLPLIASVLMTVWNLSFEPIMSVVDGHWTWQNRGGYFHVPLSNTAGWLLTTYLVFLGFALLVQRKGVPFRIEFRKSIGYLFPVMYLVQGLPSLLYPLFRPDSSDVLVPIAFITLLTMGGAAVLNLLVVRNHMEKGNPDG